MSTSTKELNKLIDEQQALLNTIKAQAMAIDSEELAQQNERLKSALKDREKSQAALKAENESLKKALAATKSALFTKMANEKLIVFSHTQKKLDRIYYCSDSSAENKLKDYEAKCRKSIDETIKAIEGYGSSEFDDILGRLNTLKAETEERKARIDKYRTEQMQNARNVNSAIGNQIKNEPLTETEKRTALKQKSLESFIGLNLLSKAGILIFIIGIVMLGRFAYVHMNDAFRGGAIYLLGIALVVIGEVFHRKEKNVFSTTLISGGVAALYAAVTTCYFAFHIYNVRVTFILCILVTAIAFALSNQVKSEIVCAFGAVGGYLPVVSHYMIGFGKAAADITFLPVSSIYFCLLAVVIFLMTYNKKWHVAKFIGYALHLIAVGGIAKCAYTIKDLPGYDYALPLAFAFAMASFAIYLLMPGIKIIKRKPILAGDSVLLALNTVSGAVSVSITLNNLASQKFMHINSERIIGFVFLAFAVIYAVLMVFSIREKREGSNAAAIITSVSALIFSMTVVPLIFGFEYAGISWAVQGAVLALISIQKRLRIPEFAGLLCMILSVPAAYFIETQIVIIITQSIILSAFWLYTVRGFISAKEHGTSSVIYVITELAAAYSTAVCICSLYHDVIESPSVSIYCGFIGCAVAISAFLAVSLIIRKGLLRNTASVIASDIAGIVLFLATFGALDITFSYSEIYSYYNVLITPKGIIALNIAALVAINVLVELFFAYSLLDIVNRLTLPPWVYTMAISVSSLMLITAGIMAQFGVKFSSVIISAVYIAVACVLLVIGFKRQFTIVRLSGLILILCAFAKLCIVDTMKIDSGWKILAYFAFGTIIITISYFYQKFSKKLEKEAENLIEK